MGEESLVRYLTPISREPDVGGGDDGDDDEFPPSSQRGWIQAPRVDVGCQTAAPPQTDRQVGCDIPRRSVETADKSVSIGSTMTKKQHERAVRLLAQSKFLLGLAPGRQVSARAKMNKVKVQRRPSTVSTPAVSVAVAATAPLTSTPLTSTPSSTPSATPGKSDRRKLSLSFQRQQRSEASPQPSTSKASLPPQIKRQPFFKGKRKSDNLQPSKHAFKRPPPPPIDDDFCPTRKLTLPRRPEQPKAVEPSIQQYFTAEYTGPRPDCLIAEAAFASGILDEEWD